MSQNKSSRGASSRVQALIATARRHPEFAQRVVQQLPEQLRFEFVDALTQPEPAAAPRPGIRKCRPLPKQRIAKALDRGLSQQLNAFARSVARVS